MTGGIGVTCMQYLRPGQQKHIDTGGAIERRPASAGRVSDYEGVADQWEGVVVALEQQAFGGNVKYVYGADR